MGFPGAFTQESFRFRLFVHILSHKSLRLLQRIFIFPMRQAIRVMQGPLLSKLARACMTLKSIDRSIEKHRPSRNCLVLFCFVLFCIALPCLALPCYALCCVALRCSLVRSFLPSFVRSFVHSITPSFAAQPAALNRASHDRHLT